MKHPLILTQGASPEELRSWTSSGSANASLPKMQRFRALEIGDVKTRAEGDEGDPEFLELEFAFASEEPVERFFGEEVLEISTRAARLGRVAQGVVPLLSNHRSDELVGRVLQVTIGSDRIARARVRFSRSAGASDVVQDVLDGIRQAVSFGYRVHKMQLTESGDDGDRFLVTDWELFEITIASMPADPSVGTHREAGDDPFGVEITSAVREEKDMKIKALHRASGAIVEIDENEIDGKDYVRVADVRPPEPPSSPPVAPRELDPQPTPDRIREMERSRIASIEQVARNFRATDTQVREAVDKGHTVEAFLGTLRLARAQEGQPLEPPPTDLDLPKRELDQFRITRAVDCALQLKKGRAPERCLELECSEQIESRLGIGARGILIPYDVLLRSPWAPDRGLDGEELSVRAPIAVGGAGATAGGALVGTDLLAGSFVDLLRNRSVLGALGATIIPGLVGNVDFPKQLTGAATAWVGEGAGSGDSPLSFGVVPMSPKTVRARSDMTRRMLLQSTPAIEQLVRTDIGISIAKAIDLAGLAGAGGGTEPEGILSMSGVGSVTYDPTSGTTENASIVALETDIAAVNADAGALGYVSTPEVRGRLKGKFKDSPGSGLAIWTGRRGEGELNGYRAEVTNALPKSLGTGTNEHPIITGFWPWLYIGEWAVLDIMVDEITLGDSGGLVVRAFADVDVAAAHEAAFSVAQLVP